MVDTTVNNTDDVWLSEDDRLGSHPQPNLPAEAILLVLRAHEKNSIVGRLRVGRVRVVFLFSRPVSSGVDSIAIKQLQISNGLKAKGVQVVWVNIEGYEITISPANIPVNRVNPHFKGRLGVLIGTLGFLWYCVATRVDCVFWDDWSLWRYSGGRRVFLQFCLRILRVRHVQDERDPLVDFAVAEGALRPGSRRYLRFARNEKISHVLTDLILLPSTAYAEAFVRRGVRPEKVFGAFRGIDAELFNSNVKGNRLRDELNLSGKFVIGFIAHFNKYRLIEEVLLPLIETTNTRIPNAFFLIAGFGDLEERLRAVCGRHPESTLLMGFIPYRQVPEYIAACDVILSPLDVRFELALNATSLKIIESLMVGTPVVATRNRATDLDFRELTGIVWVGSDLESFKDALENVANNGGYYSSQARAQATKMVKFSTTSTMPMIADKIVQSCGG